MTIKYSYLNPKAKARKSKIEGMGVFAVKKFKKGEVISIFGGKISTLKETREFPQELDQVQSFQVYDNFYLGGLGLPGGMEDVDYFNHSCQPNMGIKGQIIMVAMRDIKPKEEITFDYAISETEDLVSFKCNCGKKNCRGTITKNDWKRKDLQKKYKGYFSWYVEEKIKYATKYEKHTNIRKRYSYFRNKFVIS